MTDTNSKVTIPDAYNIVRLLLRLGSTYEDIAGLGVYIGSRRLTSRALAAWYQAEKAQRKPITAIVTATKKVKSGEDES